MAGQHPVRAQKVFKLCMLFFTAVQVPDKKLKVLLKKRSRKKRAIADFMPKSHTCSNTMHLPCGSAGFSLPSDRELFSLYDYAFKNTYFGIV